MVTIVSLLLPSDECRPKTSNRVIPFTTLQERNLISLCSVLIPLLPGNS